jgi:hypothetical protein
MELGQTRQQGGGWLNNLRRQDSGNRLVGLVDQNGVVQMGKLRWEK